MLGSSLRLGSAVPYQDRRAVFLRPPIASFEPASMLASPRLRSLPAVNSPTNNATFTTIQNPIITPKADIGVSSLDTNDRWGTGRVPAESATLLGFLTP